MAKVEHECDDLRCQCQHCARDTYNCCLNQSRICPDFWDYDPNYRCPDFEPEEE